MVPHRKTQCGNKKNVSSPKPVLPFGSSQICQENPSIPTWPSLGQCEGFSGLPAAPRGRPGLPEIPGASWCQGNRPDHEGTSRPRGEAAKGLRVEGAQPGLVSIALCWTNERVGPKFPLPPPRYLVVARGRREMGGRGVDEGWNIRDHPSHKTDQKLRLREGKGHVHGHAASLGKVGTRSLIDTFTARSLYAANTEKSFHCQAPYLRDLPLHAIPLGSLSPPPPRHHNTRLVFAVFWLLLSHVCSEVLCTPHNTECCHRLQKRI